MTEELHAPTPSEVVTPEAADLLSTFRLAAMDGYNERPVGSVETWVEEGKKRMLLLYLAGKRDGAASSAPPTQEPVAWAVLNADGKVPFVHLERLVAEGEAEMIADKEGRLTVALALGFLSPERYVTNANK